ncbi:MAG: hypothetical protein ATN36_05580 [Epulopiscium sp. Nele67-Bin005]|nr:MAG: hypothetical protein ATN36_05580 [Epulopiscium sp. Nele67-Bin005]
MKINIPHTNKNSHKNIIGLRLRNHRKEHKITQEHLSARLQLQGLSIDRTTISKIERGERLVLDYEIVAIAKALNVEIKWLLTGE